MNIELALTILEWGIFTTILIFLITKIIKNYDPYTVDYGIDLITPLLLLVTVMFILIWGGVFWW